MAQILEDVYSKDPAAVAPRLATHFEEGRQPEQAHSYALTAAERASRVYAHWDALEQIQRALRNAPDEARQSEAWLRLGEAYVAIAQYADALHALDEALQRLGPAPDPGRSIHVRRRRILVESMQGGRSLDELLESLIELRQEARVIGDRAEECHIIWHMIDLPGTTDSMDVVLAREALALAQQLDDRWLLARGHEVLGVTLAFGPAPRTAIDELERAIALYGELGDRSREAGCRSNLALARVFLGDMQSGAQEFDATIRIFDEIVDPMRGAAIRSNLGALLRILGEYESAEQRLRESIRFFERLGGTVRLISPLMNLAEVHEARGEWNEAEVLWLEMLTHARETGYRGEQIIAHCGIGTARLKLGDLQGAITAEHAARNVLSDDPESGGEGGEALQLFSARLAAAAGEREGAIGMLERLEAAATGRDRYLAATYQLEKAEILAGLNIADAHTLAARARAEFEALGARPAVERADRLIALVS
jgi:tetratricopeptide (TPR) repeat protein